MKPEIKTQLIAALRSGDYQQGYGWLNSEGCHCFGGVLCDLAVKAGMAKWEPITSEPNSHLNLFSCIVFSSVDSKCSSSVPAKVLEWADFDQMLAYEGSKRDFYDLNDCQRLTFAQFADLLEKQP
jgi:hypothetical protein